MKSNEEETILPPVFQPLHFVKLEGSSQNDTNNYSLKNHFNSPILQAERSKMSDKENEMELRFIEPRARKGKQKNDSVFFFATIKGVKKSESESDNHPAMVCHLTSTTGQTFIHITAVKDKSSSTYNYKAVDSKKNEVFQIQQKQISTGQNELAIRTVAEKNPTADLQAQQANNDNLIARINLDDDEAACLSMAPELDMMTKARLIGILTLLEVVKSQHLGNSSRNNNT